MDWRRQSGIRHPLLVAFLFASTACRNGLGEQWAQYNVNGVVTDSYGRLVSSEPVIVTTWPPYQCGSGRINQLASTSTNSQGFYSVRLNPIASTFSACFRLSAASRDTDTTVINKPALQAVQINILVP